MTYYTESEKLSEICCLLRNVQTVINRNRHNMAQPDGSNNITPNKILNTSLTRLDKVFRRKSVGLNKVQNSLPTKCGQR